MKFLCILLLSLTVVQTDSSTEKTTVIETTTTYATNTTIQASITTTPYVDPCHCENTVFSIDEMTGRIKSRSHSCPKYITCTFIIEPKKDFIVTLSKQSSFYSTVTFFYYSGSTKKEDVIYVNSLSSLVGDTLVAPSGFGFLVNASFARYNPFFKLEFNRINASDTRYICPFPFLQATDMPQKVNTSYWPLAGCAFRITADHPLNLHSKCASDAGTIVRYNLVGTTTSKILAWNGYEYPSQNTFPKAVDVSFYVPRFFYDRLCEISYFALPYDPCNCSNTSFNLSLDQTMTLQSPGWPNMLCNNLKCNYNVSLIEKPKPGSKTAYVISAFHQSRGSYDNLQISIDDRVVATLDEYSANMTDSAIYVGDLLEVDYVASSVLSNDHGFEMHITAIHMSDECFCSTDKIKVLDPFSRTYTFTIKPHCPIMNCRFRIENESPGINRMFRLKIDYHLPHDGELIDIDAGAVEHRRLGDLSVMVAETTGHDVIDFVTNSSVRITYLREKMENISMSIGESNFTLKWEWLTSGDCKCEEETRLSDVDHWEYVYSPRHPHEYCNDMRCIYKIQAPPGHHVQMNVTFFETEPHVDFVYFFEGFSQNITQRKEKKDWITRLEGFKRNLSIIETKGRNATIYFESDRSYTQKGFKIMYRAHINKELPIETNPWSLLLTVFTTIGVLLFIGIAAFFVNRHLPKKEHLQVVENPVYSFSAVEDILIIVDAEK